MKHENNVQRIALLLLVGTTICTPLVLFNQAIPTDTSSFYAPMIRRIAGGNVSAGFFPMIPPLFSAIGGLLAAVLQVHPFTAAKITSAMFYILTVLPLFGITRRIWDEKVAFWACLLYLFTDRLIRYGGAGGLDTGKMFFLTLTVFYLLLFMEKYSLASSLGIGISSASLSLIRGEGIVFGCLALVFVTVLSFKNKSTGRSMALVSVAFFSCLVILGPWMLYCYRTTGYPVTDSRQISFFKPLASALNYSPTVGLPATPFRQLGNNGVASLDHQSWIEIVKNTIMGLYPFYAVFAILGLVIWTRAKKWNATSICLASIPILHTAILILILTSAPGGVIEKRYIICVLPLYVGWAVVGFQAAAIFLRKKFPTVAFRIALGFIMLSAAISLWVGYSSLHPNKFHRHQIDMEKACAVWIAETGSNYVPRTASILTSNQTHYHNQSLPIIMTVRPQIAIWADADLITPSRLGHQLTSADFTRAFRSYGGHYLIIEKYFMRQYPAFSTAIDKNPLFVAVHTDSDNGNWPYKIFGFTENLNLPKTCTVNLH